MPADSTNAPVLIVSTGRTGTRFLAEHLAARYPEVEAHHITEWSTLVNVLGNLELAGLLSERTVLSVWRRLKSGRFGVTPCAHFVDSNNHLYAFARYARALYPEVRVVHVVRDPRTYVPSHLNWAKQRPKSFVANHLLPFWQPNGWLVGELPARVWLGMSRFERFCWIWDFKNRLMAGMETSATPYLRLRFEDFTGPEHSRDCLGRLARFIGVAPRDEAISLQAVNRTTRRPMADWRQWPERLCRQIERHCGAQMRAYGYGQEPEWLTRLGCRAS